MQALELSQAVLDPYTVRILLGTSHGSASALDLSRRFGIPIAACYRRIRELERIGLVYCERALPSRNGKGLQLFRSRLKSVRVVLEEGQLRTVIVLEDGDGSRATEQVLRLTEASRNA